MNVFSNFSPHAKAPATAKNQQRSSRKAPKTPGAHNFIHRSALRDTDFYVSFQASPNTSAALKSRPQRDRSFRVSSVHKLLHSIVFITALRQAALGDRSAGSQQQRGSAPIHSPRHGICFEYRPFTGNVPPKLTQADHWGMPRPQPTIAGL